MEDEYGHYKPNLHVYKEVVKQVCKLVERYNDKPVKGVNLRIYLYGFSHEEIKKKYNKFNDKKIFLKILNYLNTDISTIKSSEQRPLEDPASTSMHRKKPLYPDYVTALKKTPIKKRGFIVADIETILIDDVHNPYAAGFLIVQPGDDLSNKTEVERKIETYYSEDYALIHDEFLDRSKKVMKDFLKRLNIVVKHNNVRTVYFHNLGRFDGIILLKHLLENKIKFKVVIRNNQLYQISVYQKNRILYRLRDSLKILPQSLEKLARL